MTGRVGAGKFGWRAQTPTLDQFVRGACAGELGLQVARTPQTQDLADETYVSLGVDMQEQEVRQLVHFVQQLPEPRQETRLPTESVDARSGQRLFAKIGCIECHVQHVAPARHIYSDLLLHDMGRLLQAPAPAPLGISGGLVSRIRVPFFAPERRPIGSGNFRFSIGGYYGSPSAQLPTPFAMQRPSYPKFPRGQTPDRLYDRIPPHEWTWDRLQREWRTPPLWGVADSAPYLHDGRAETLDAAILWHGGEAQDSTTKYRSLSRDDRRQVVAFLKSLRAPVVAARQPERSVSEQMAGTMAFQFLNDEHQRAALRDAAVGVSVFDRPW